MDLKLFNIFLTCVAVWPSESFSVSSDRITTVGMGTIISNERIRSVVSHVYEDEYIYNRNCGGVLIEAPGKIELKFEKKHRCTWKIHAPADHRIYVQKLEIFRDTPVEASDTEDKSVNLEIYDGDKVEATKRLFKLDVDKLDNSISRGQNLTIDLQYSKTGVHTNHELRLSYGFIKETELY